VTTTVPDLMRRRLGRPPRPTPRFWLAALFVTVLGGALRLINLGHPPEKMFDEVYYADEAWDLLGHGVEWEPGNNGPQYVVHPPLGKWMIAAGEQVFGYNALGWRISAAVIGTLSILVVILVAQRLFRSTVMACAAGLLVALDGMHFVLSRAALLDIFLMFFVIAGFGCLVLDREQRRARRLRLIDAGEPGSADAGRSGFCGGQARRFGTAVPWWRLAAGLCVGLACGVKWSGIWFLFVYAALILLWEAGARRSAGERWPWLDALRGESAWIVAFFAIAVGAYLATWYGWFATDNGYFRHWYADEHHTARGGPIDALLSLAYYHQTAYTFHTGLAVKHPYQSWPWQWLLLGRPVRFYFSSTLPCGESSCAADVLLLGTPLLWWSFLPALVGGTWLGIARRDWRATAVIAGALTGIVPWFWSELDNRTMFAFYALPAEPFLVLAVVYVLGAIVGHTADQRLVGALVAGAYVLLVAACFAYFYPVYAGESLPSAEWFARMWLDRRWA
jgi:dolichyl-phosphate-mannose--protein O-mannosyl transferase